ncbi:hypothetical protein Dimus_015686 [Dionaea muscipula]
MDIVHVSGYFILNMIFHKSIWTEIESNLLHNRRDILLLHYKDYPLDLPNMGVVVAYLLLLFFSKFSCNCHSVICHGKTKERRCRVIRNQYGPGRDCYFPTCVHARSLQGGRLSGLD